MSYYMYGMDAVEPQRCASVLKQKGYQGVMNSSTDQRMVEAALAQGLQYDLSVGAFSLGGGFSRPAQDCQGRERRWFGSGCPCDPAMRQARLEGCAKVAATPGVRAVMLDGARFASFASGEGAESFFTCFCPICRQKAREMGFDAEKMRASVSAFYRFTQNGEGSAEAVLDGLSDWLAFRARSTNEFFADFARVVHAQGKLAGAFVFAPSLAGWVGQAQAGACGLDILSPMLYRRYPHAQGPACLNHEWAALMRLMEEKTGLSRAQAASLTNAPQNLPEDILGQGFAPEQIGRETACLTGGAYRLSPILQREDERVLDSIRMARAAGAQDVGLFAYESMESIPDIRAIEEEL